jgi:hypothetical protein
MGHNIQDDDKRRPEYRPSFNHAWNREQIDSVLLHEDGYFFTREGIVLRVASIPAFLTIHSISLMENLSCLISLR